MSMPLWVCPPRGAPKLLVNETAPCTGQTQSPLPMIWGGSSDCVGAEPDESSDELEEPDEEFPEELDEEFDVEAAARARATRASYSLARRSFSSCARSSCSACCASS